MRQAIWHIDACLLTELLTLLSLYERVCLFIISSLSVRYPAILSEPILSPLTSYSLRSVCFISPYSIFYNIRHPPLAESRDGETSYLYGSRDRGSKERRDASRYEEFDRFKREEDTESSSCTYSRVALTAAITLADFFARMVTAKALERSSLGRDSLASPVGQSRGSGAAGLFPLSLVLDPPKGSHIYPKGTSESRRNSFKMNKAAIIVSQCQNQMTRRSLAVSQSLHAVAPWLKKALHPEFQTFLSDRLNLPSAI